MSSCAPENSAIQKLSLIIIVVVIIIIIIIISSSSSSTRVAGSAVGVELGEH